MQLESSTLAVCQRKNCGRDCRRPAFGSTKLLNVFLGTIDSLRRPTRQFSKLSKCQQEAWLARRCHVRSHCRAGYEHWVRIVPAELSPHLRLQLTDQPEELVGKLLTSHCAPPGSLIVASASLTDDYETLKGSNLALSTVFFGFEVTARRRTICTVSTMSSCFAIPISHAYLRDGKSTSDWTGVAPTHIARGIRRRLRFRRSLDCRAVVGARSILAARGAVRKWFHCRWR